MIKAVCFDLDGVYFTPKGMEMFKNMLSAVGISQEKIDLVLYKSEQMKLFKLGKISEEEFWNFARDEWNISIPISMISELIVQNYEIDPDLDNLVKQLREKGIKTCLCSNNHKTKIEGLENKFHFLQNFDLAIFSYKEGVLKPDKEIFQRLINKLEVKPEELVYSDDNELRLTGAKELGINTFVYNGFEKFKVNLEKLGIEL